MVDLSPVDATTLRIASRGSELALWQSRAVRDALRAADPSLTVDIDVMKTTGDVIQDVPLAKIGDKGLFTKELDAALLEGRADLAVHSLKDVPTRLPEGLVLAAVTEREDPRDVLILPPGGSGDLDSLPPGARVGTSSLRRRAQLQALRPDLAVLDLRGNLNTRLAKLDRGDYDAIILAAAGVLRLGWADRIAAYLDAPAWLPAVGQGALAVVARADRADVVARLRALHDPRSAACTAAERALLRSLEGGCQVPIGALGRVEGDRVVLHGLVAELDGGRILRVEESGPVDEAESVGRRAADALLANGAGEVLAGIRAAVASSPAAP
ncbi:hydroxymethylbilane synthase [Longimicrobium sp.]|uniref:hydroxymethylbilane synthase n=1 Tax=Longimicrobium sp. TaxID=2029185 RepID=UPI002E355EA1|nr:hydroxymethylbilane synthase [Longimicrobium sp.]HEX6041569.1 hydroxymethylbilane synthase [Longimicrobium sp.]